MPRGKKKIEPKVEVKVEKRLSRKRVFLSLTK